jgi:hypothetical protein
MPTLEDYVNSDPFSIRALTDAQTAIPYKPKELGQWLDWDIRGEVTDKLSIEMKEGTLSVLQEMPRGAPGQTVEEGNRKLVSATIPHYPQTQTIKPAEFQGKRVFGSDNELETAEMRKNEKQQLLRDANEITWEFLKAGAIQGVTLQKNGDVSQDWFNLFGVQRNIHEIDFTNVNADLNEEVLLAKEKSEDELGDTSADGYILICGRNMHSKFRTHKSTKAAFDRLDYSQFFRSDVRPGFQLSSDVNIVSYGRAKVGDTWFIDPDEAFLCPRAPIYKGRFAPADMLDAANTIGIPEYVSSKVLDHNKGIELFAETNPIFWVARPRAIIHIRQK